MLHNACVRCIAKRLLCVMSYILRFCVSDESDLAGDLRSSMAPVAVYRVKKFHLQAKSPEQQQVGSSIHLFMVPFMQCIP